MEILAPAGDYESFMTAINSGANAIYLGLGDFNARAKSTFFTTDNIREYIAFAHLHKVKVYLTVNTLLFDDEIPAFITFITKCMDCKFDAFIIQDYAVAYLIHNAFPDAELHASTQLGIHNAEGASIAKELGFTRVVLSREVKEQDITAIKALGLEIEYFVQGALCVAFSGNCYFSSLKHKQSGNRGKCLQLCRLPYSAKSQGKILTNGYLLSARDLCLINNLQKLKQLGVDSLKIEGRLRRAGYVAQAVTKYRLAVDNISCNATQQDINYLRLAFSRGDFLYNAYLNQGVPNNIINKESNNHLGLQIGTVINVSPFKDLYKITLSANSPINSGDGLKFLLDGKEVASLGVGNVNTLGQDKYEIFSKNKIPKSATIYQTLNAEKERLLLAKKSKIKITAKVIAKQNLPLQIELSNEDVCIKEIADYVCPAPQNSPITKTQIIEQINKTQDTEFEFTEIIVDTDSVFIPKSIVNETRRKAISQLQQQILNYNESRIKNNTNLHFLNSITTISAKTKISENNIYIINETTDLSKLVVNANDIFALSPIAFNIKNISNLIAKVNSNFSNIQLAVNLPVIANHLDMLIIKNCLANLPEIKTLISNNIYGLFFAKNGYKIIAGFGMNIHNEISAFCVKNLGIDSIMLSKELACKNLQVDWAEYQFMQGKTPLMHFAHCPYKTIYNQNCEACKHQSDLSYLNQQNEEFAILSHKLSQCYFILFSDKEYCTDNPLGKICDLRI